MPHHELDAELIMGEVRCVLQPREDVTYELVKMLNL